ncbi:MAG: glycosyltransferase family 4 protein [Myxococcales bacterium]|nr:glycosyltransferase family 4 protein [Myxococcales bacterium]
MKALWKALQSKEDASSKGQVVHLTRRMSERSWGGMETRVTEIARMQQSQGDFFPKIMTSSIYEDAGSQCVRGIPVERFSYQYPFWGLDEPTRASMDQVGGNLISWPLFWALCRHPGLSVVHAHCTRRLGGMGWLASRLRGVPFVVTLHGDVMTLASAQAERFSELARGGVEWGKAVGWLVRARRLLDESDGIIAVGKEEYDALCKILPKEQVHFVPGGVDVERFSKGSRLAWRERLEMQSGEFLLVQVGRIDAQKNQLLSVKLLARLRAAGLPVRLLLIGPVTDDGYDAALQDAIRSNGLGAWVHQESVGYAEQRLVDAFHAADVMLMPSIHEPFGLTVLEGWCAKKPVLASRLGGLRGLVSDGEDGCLLPVGEDDAWFASCRALLQAPERAKQMGEQGSRKVDLSYTWVRVVERLSQIYRLAEEVRLRRMQTQVELRWLSGMSALLEARGGH